MKATSKVNCYNDDISFVSNISPKVILSDLPPLPLLITEQFRLNRKFFLEILKSFLYPFNITNVKEGNDVFFFSFEGWAQKVDYGTYLRELIDFDL